MAKVASVNQRRHVSAWRQAAQRRRGGENIGENSGGISENSIMKKTGENGVMNKYQ
jgi:hypothetical protein